MNFIITYRYLLLLSLHDLSEYLCTPSKLYITSSVTILTYTINQSHETFDFISTPSCCTLFTFRPTVYHGVWVIHQVLSLCRKRLNVFFLIRWNVFTFYFQSNSHDSIIYIILFPRELRIVYVRKSSRVSKLVKKNKTRTQNMSVTQTSSFVYVLRSRNRWKTNTLARMTFTINTRKLALVCDPIFSFLANNPRVMCAVFNSLFVSGRKICFNHIIHVYMQI